VSFEFKVFKLTEEFHSICDWREYKIPISKHRPGLLLIIEDEKYPDSFCCIPITKDDDKDQKYKKLMEKKPHQVHPIHINEYDSYLLIQNMFYVRKEFVGAPFTVNNIHTEVKNETIQSDIIKKVNKMNALFKHGRCQYFVPRERVFAIQQEYLLQNKT
jgi:hypothetical protein